MNTPATLKSELLKIVADVSAPIGPEVFSGFGSAYQNAVNELDQPADRWDLEEKYVADWVNQQVPDELLFELFEVLRNPPLVYCNRLPQRRPDQWNDAFEQVMAEFGKCHPKMFFQKSNATFEESPPLRMQLLGAICMMETKESEFFFLKYKEQNAGFCKEVRAFIQEIIAEIES